MARELSRLWGVLEPLQTATSLEEQVMELKGVLEEDGEPPVTLIGWSWGAMLSFVCAALHPTLVRKLILVGSAPFEEEYAVSIMETRLGRLTDEDRLEACVLMEALDNPAIRDKDTPFAKLGELFSKADSYDPLTLETEVIECQYHINQRVWQDAGELRRSGRLLELGKRIQCPVVAIHGDYDPHPSAGVLEPLSLTLRNFRFLLLENCGHLPWLERRAKDRFYDILRQELG